MLIRHGARSTTNTYFEHAEDKPDQDPFITYSNKKYGFGQLTTTGKRQQYLLGKQLRKEYPEIYDNLLLYKNIDVSSTFYNRTFHSAQSLLAGLFPRGKIFDYQFEDYNDERYFPKMTIDKDIITEEQKKQPYRGDYYPIKITTAP